MGAFRRTEYEISTTKASESQYEFEKIEELKQEVHDCIFKALDAYGAEDPHSWIALPSDGYWAGFRKHDASGMKIRLIYHFPFESAKSVTLALIWDRPGIKSKFFPASEANLLVDTWQSAIEREIRKSGSNLKKQY